MKLSLKAGVLSIITIVLVKIFTMIGLFPFEDRDTDLVIMFLLIWNLALIIEHFDKKEGKGK